MVKNWDHSFAIILHYIVKYPPVMWRTVVEQVIIIYLLISWQTKEQIENRKKNRSKKKPPKSFLKVDFSHYWVLFYYFMNSEAHTEIDSGNVSHVNRHPHNEAPKPSQQKANIILGIIGHSFGIQNRMFDVQCSWDFGFGWIEWIMNNPWSWWWMIIY